MVWVGCPWWGAGLCYSLYVALLQVRGVLPPLEVGTFSLVLDSFWRCFFGLVSQQDKYFKLKIKFGHWIGLRLGLSHPVVVLYLH